MLRTFVGLYLRELGGWISISALLELFADAEISHSSTRSAVSRLKDKGELIPERRELLTGGGTGSSGVAGYRLDPRSLADLERGDRRIFSYRVQGGADDWCLVSYSLPEVDRVKRTQLRRQLMGLGFGAVTDGLWIAPGHLLAEIEEALETLEVRDRATIFLTRTPLTSEPFEQAAAKWWDLDRLAGRHHEFLSRYEPVAEHAAAGREAFILWLRCVDDWKTIPYVDPGLPASALPDGWPGERSVALFALLRSRLEQAAWDYVSSAAPRRQWRSATKQDR